MSKQTLVIRVEFPQPLSPHGERDVKRAVQEFKESIEWLGKVVSADLEPASKVQP